MVCLGSNLEDTSLTPSGTADLDPRLVESVYFLVTILDSGASNIVRDKRRGEREMRRSTDWKPGVGVPKVSLWLAGRFPIRAEHLR